MERRFFSDKIDGEVVWIMGDELRHMNVLRLTVGDTVTLVDGSGYDYRAKIMDFSRDAAQLNILGKSMNMRETPFCVELFQAVCKGDKNDFIVQKAVELGAKSVRFFTSENTVKGDINAVRLQKISDEAVKQCRRSQRITVEKSMCFSDLLSAISGFDRVLFCNECECSRNIGEALSKAPVPDRTAVIIGSEGGFTEKEIKTLSQLAVSVTLGARILRAETAAVSALSIVIYELTNLNGQARANGQ